MLSFQAHLKVFLATAPCDLRANFNGLWVAAQERLGEDPESGALFVFGNPHLLPDLPALAFNRGPLARLLPKQFERLQLAVFNRFSPSLNRFNYYGLC